MTDDKPSSPHSGKITVGNISNVDNLFIADQIHGINLNYLQGGDEISKRFAELSQKVNAMPDGPDKGVAQTAVKELEAQARKGNQADVSTISKWFDFLVKTAPDAGEVAVATFINPIQGLSTAFQKIAARVKAEREAKR